MTEQDRLLLIQDLCARLPYKVVIRCTDSDTDYKCFLTKDILDELIKNYMYYDYKPYLRSLSSITKEEEIEFEHLFNQYYISKTRNTVYCTSRGDLNLSFIKWLNAHHFDYFGLIKIGLALEATGDVLALYKNKLEN